MAATKSIKILVLGDPATGKTSLIRRYTQNMFPDHHKPTLGVDFALKQLKVEGHGSVHVHLWDVAGQDRFTGINRVYYKDAFGALIVYDMTRPKTFQKTIKWKQEIDGKGVRLPQPDDSPLPCMLIGNKCDLPNPKISSKTLDQFCEKAKFIGWMETSAKTDTNVDEAMMVLVKHILEKHPKIFAEEKDDTLNVGETTNANAGGCGC